MDRHHQVTGPVAECACPSCYLHHEYQAALAERTSECDELKAINVEPGISLGAARRWKQECSDLTIQKDSLARTLYERTEERDALAEVVHELNDLLTVEQKTFGAPPDVSNAENFLAARLAQVKREFAPKDALNGETV